MEERKELFAGFPAVTKEQWKQQVIKDLKGADFAEILQYHTPDQITVDPFYTTEDLAGLQPAGPLFNHTDWDICTVVDVANDAAAANKKALHQLENGATGIIFEINSDVDLDALLKDIQIAYIFLQFNIRSNAAAFNAGFGQYLEAQSLQPDQLNVTLNYDPIGQLVRSGNYIQNKEADLTSFTAHIKETGPARNICINGDIYHNAGASTAYELGCMLAHANEYLNLLQYEGRLQINIATGPDYFTEIAKLRALRNVFSLLLQQYGRHTDIHIHAVSALRNLTVYDNHNNLLRTTTEAMSAAAGGCNSLTVLPFDTAFTQPDEFSERLARNIQIILKSESHFDKVADVSAGSFFIETLTEQLAAAAWNYFKGIEANGGFLTSLEQGSIQQSIRQFCETEQQLFDDNKKVLVGINKFPNPAQHMLEKVKKGIQGTTGTATAIEPLLPVRLSGKAEAARLAKEKEGQTA